MLVGKLSGTEGELVDVFAGTVSRTVIGASGALASLSFVAVKALALARLTVAKSNTNLRVINPRELEGADSVGAITSVKGHTKTPIVITNTEATVTFTMTTARVVAASGGASEKGKRESSSKFHF